ncbi:MAG: arsenate reductase ArsC [Arenicella sp.]|nr:arsenate reductase ArsC [Arenicella sp.]
MKLLFICTHNRCRSILAEALVRHISDGTIIAKSAGSSPQGEVHPLTLKYLTEHKISTDGLRSRSWHQFEDYNPDVILTLCDSAAQETCPVWFEPSVQVHWALSDPSKKAVNEDRQRALFDATISILERRIQALLGADQASLTGDALPSTLNQIAAQID